MPSLSFLVVHLSPKGGAAATFNVTIGASAIVLVFASVIGVSVTSSDRSLLNRILSVPPLGAFGEYSQKRER
jgi:hypothetical protein